MFLTQINDHEVIEMPATVIMPQCVYVLRCPIKPLKYEKLYSN